MHRRTVSLYAVHPERWLQDTPTRPEWFGVATYLETGPRLRRSESHCAGTESGLDGGEVLEAVDGTGPAMAAAVSSEVWLAILARKRPRRLPTTTPVLLLTMLLVPLDCSSASLE